MSSGPAGPNTTSATMAVVLRVSTIQSKLLKQLPWWRTLCLAQRVRNSSDRDHGRGFKSFHHPVVGEMTLAYEGMDMEAQHGLTFTVYTAEPGSKSEEAVRLLASWGASEYAVQDEPGHLDVDSS